VYGAKFEIGDCNSKMASCYVEVEKTDPDEMTFAAEFKKGLEVVITCARTREQGLF
jgi:hypothetical protein